MNITDNLPDSHDFTLIPLRLNQAEVDTYTARGWRYRPTSILTTYKENWTEWFAIREFVQNSLDETGAFDLLFEDEENISYIVDQGEGIDVKDMFLGQQKGATEEEVHCLRGVFGEGMKLALIPLLNDNKKIIIRTVGVDYFFCFILETGSRKGDFEYIGMLTRPNEITKGTAVAIEGVNCLKYMKFFSPTIAETDPDKVIISVKGGVGPYDHCKTRQAYDIPGMIFVRDIFVQYADSLFGYNFWFDSTKEALGSDRMELRNYMVVGEELAKLINASAVAEEKTFIVKLFKRLELKTFTNVDGTVFSPSQSLEWRSLSGSRAERYLTSESALEIFRAIYRQVGRDFSWSENIAEQKALEHAGIQDLRNILPDLRDFLVKHSLVKDPKNIMLAAELTDQTIVFDTTDILSSSFGYPDEREELAEAFKVIVDQTTCFLSKIAWETSKCKNTKLFFYIGEYEHEERVAGFYNPKEDEIFIRVKNMKDYGDYIRVFIHEAAHAYCHTTDRYSYEKADCSDLSQGFENALEMVAFQVLRMSMEGLCDTEEIERQIKIMWQNEELLGAIIQQKLQVVNNPKGLVRPKHENDKDKRTIDETFSRIAKGCYTTPTDIKAILDGYAPSKYNYATDFWNNRSGRADELMVAKHDQVIIRKLGIEAPPWLQDLSKDKLETWNIWVRGDCPDSPTDNIRFLYPGEDHGDFYASAKLFANHPDPRVKRRNFLACQAFMNPRENYSDLEETLSWTEVRDEHLGRGTRANVGLIQYLMGPALMVMDQDRELYFCLDHSSRWAWASLKEQLIEFAGIEAAVNHGWGAILTNGETSLHQDNRRYTARAYRDLAKSRPNSKRFFYSLENMLKKEEHPEVMSNILGFVKQIMGVKYLGSPSPENKPFQKFIMDNYDHISNVATIKDDISYYREPLLEFLGWAKEMVKLREQNWQPPNDSTHP